MHMQSNQNVSHIRQAHVMTWNRDFLAKLKVMWVVKLPFLDGTKKCIFVFTGACV